MALQDMVEIANPQQPHCPTVLLLDTSGSMSEAGKINALNEGLVAFRDEVAGDELASKRIDLAVVTFGANVQVLHVFSFLNNMPVHRDPGTTATRAVLDYDQASVTALLGRGSRLFALQYSGIGLASGWSRVPRDN